MSLKPKRGGEKFTPDKLTNQHLTAIIDLDFIKYAASAAGEKRTIKVTYIPTGSVKEFANKTEFVGRGKTIGGWLGEQNVKRVEKGLPKLSLEDFTIEVVQTAEPVENLLHTAKLMVYSILEYLGTDKYKCFIGKGESWRVAASTLLKYKGQRTDLIKPVHFEEVSQYLEDKFEATVVEGLECDEVIVIEHLKDPENTVVVGLDKDGYTCPIKYLNPQRLEDGIVDCNGYGKLWIEGTGSKEKIRGKGRAFLYYQVLSQDSIDNYKFNCFSDIKWGEKSAYKALVGCKNDKEAIEVMLQVGKKLYPEPKEVTGWRGNKFTIDYMYVLRECYTMAKMKESEYQVNTFDDLLIKYEVNYE